jgi:hypothetical protein
MCWFTESPFLGTSQICEKWQLHLVCLFAVCLSLCSHGTTWLPPDGFSLSLIWVFFCKYPKKIQVSLKSDKNNFTWKSIYIFYCISLIPSQNENVSDKSCIGNQGTHFIFNHFFRKSCHLWDNVEKYCGAREATDENKTHAQCTLDTQGYKHTIRMCNTYCFFTAMMVARTHFRVLLHVHCLSCCWLYCVHIAYCPFSIASVPPSFKVQGRYQWRVLSCHTCCPVVF